MDTEKNKGKTKPMKYEIRFTKYASRTTNYYNLSVSSVVKF